MYIDYRLHFLLALWSLLCGGFLGAVYDVFRSGRRAGRAWLFVSDLAFSVICTVTMLLLFFNLSFGRMRAYSFLLVLVGFLLWRASFGKLFFPLLCRVRRACRDLVRRILSAAKRKFCLALRFLYTKKYCRNKLLLAKHGYGLRRMLGSTTKKDVFNDKKEPKE